ncbi:hypothetical protein M5689_002495 [Euphorbia peplus]|nr:hypothetical protein M5689_002495 [Euphorbia peplus]
MQGIEWMDEGEKKRHVDFSSGPAASDEHLAGDFEGRQVKRSRVEEDESRLESEHLGGDSESHQEGVHDHMAGVSESHQDKEMPPSLLQSPTDDEYFQQMMKRLNLYFRERNGGDVSDPHVGEFKEFRSHRMNPTIFSNGLRYGKIALESYEKRKPDVKYEIVEELFSYCKSLKLPGHVEYADVRQWCHVSFIAKPKNSGGTPERFFAEIVLDHDSGTQKVVNCCTFTPTDAVLTDGCRFCCVGSRKIHPVDGYISGRSQSVFPSILQDEYLDKVDGRIHY